MRLSPGGPTKSQQRQKSSKNVASCCILLHFPRYCKVEDGRTWPEECGQFRLTAPYSRRYGIPNQTQNAYLDELEWRFNDRGNPWLLRDTLLRLLKAEPTEIQGLGGLDRNCPSPSLWVYQLHLLNVDHRLVAHVDAEGGATPSPRRKGSANDLTRYKA